MNQDDYKRYHDHPLRTLFSNLAGGYTDGIGDSRSALREAIREALPSDGHDPEGEAKVYAALEAKALEVARGARDAEDRLEYRGRVDNGVVAILKELDAADSILGPPEQGELDDGELDAILRGTDRYSSMVGGDLARAEDEERARAQALIDKAQA